MIDLRAGRKRGIHVCGDRHGAPSVHPVNRGCGPCEAGGRHLPQRDLATGCPHQVALHIGCGVALVLGQAHVNPHVLAPALHPEHFGSEECRAHLGREMAHRQIEGAGRRIQLQLQLPEPLVEVGANVEDAVDTGQLGDELVSDHGQPVGVRMRELEVNRQSERDQVRRNRERPRIRQGSGFLPPQPLEGGRGDVMTFPFDEFELHRPEVPAGRLDGVSAQRVVECRRPPNRYGDANLQGFRLRTALPLNPLQRAMPRGLQLRRNRRCTLTRRADRHFQIGGDDLAFDGGQKLVGDHAGTDDSQGQHQQPAGGGKHDGGLVDRQAQATVQWTVHSPLQEAIHAFPDTSEPAG